MRIGVDLGGTKIEAAAIDRAGEYRARRRTPSPKGDYAATISAVTELTAAVIAEAGDDGDPIPGIGAGVPGTPSPTTGLMRNANSTWLIGKPLHADLESAFGRPVRLANDANCFAVSEAVDGAGAGRHVVFGVIIGTGVGGGVAVDGAVMEGANAIAGEWGHNPLPWPREDEYPGAECYCGKHGCVETWLSGPARARLGEDPGDERYIDRLARALASVANIIDPDIFVLGGGVSNVDSLYDGRLERLLEHYAFTDALTAPVVRNMHGDSGGVRGAAWLWR